MHELGLIIEASVSDQRLDLAIQDLQNFFIERFSNRRPVNIVF